MVGLVAVMDWDGGGTGGVDSIEVMDIDCPVRKASCMDGSDCRGGAAGSLSSFDVLRVVGEELRPLEAPTTELAVEDG